MVEAEEENDSLKMCFKARRWLAGGLHVAREGKDWVKDDHMTSGSNSKASEATDLEREFEEEQIGSRRLG